ncbi:AsmA-like C-terminal region-containing protein [PVC group bacterium]|nr:AsmA-like C-terminal region-containing protein [PVC group bacterium]
MKILKTIKIALIGLLALVLLLGVLVLLYFNVILSKEDRIALLKNLIVSVSGQAMDFSDVHIQWNGQISMDNFETTVRLETYQDLTLKAETMAFVIDITKLLSRVAKIKSFTLSRPDIRLPYYHNIQIQGENISGEFDNGWQLKKGSSFPTENISLDLEDITFRSNLNPTAIEHIFANIRIHANQMTLRDAEMKIQNKHYYFELTHQKEEPNLVLDLHGPEDFDLALKINSLDTMEITNFSFRHPSLSMEAHGQLGALANIQLEFSGTAQAKFPGILDDYSKYLPDDFVSLPIKGGITVSFNVKGTSLDYKTWMVAATFTSPTFTYDLVEFKNFSMKAHFQNSLFETTQMKATIFEGVLEGYIMCDLSESPPRFKTIHKIKDMNLNTLLNTYSKNKGHFSGDLDLAIDLDGIAGQPETYTGIGSLALKNGRLFKLPVLSGLPILSVIPGLGSTRITDGNGSFAIKNELIMTNDFVFKGSNARAKIEGTIGFDQRLNLLVNIQSQKSGIPFVGGILKKVQDTLGIVPVVQITGTLNDPKYYVKPVKAPSPTEADQTQAAPGKQDSSQDTISKIMKLFNKDEDAPPPPDLKSIIDLIPFDF